VHFVDFLELPLEDLFFILFVIWEERAQVFDPRRTNQVFVIFFFICFVMWSFGWVCIGQKPDQ
jgi:hypothetical protein